MDLVLHLAILSPGSLCRDSGTGAPGRRPHLPNDRNHHGSHHQVVGLVVEQIAHYAVVPFGNVPEVRPGETIRAREEIIPGTERGEVHVHVPLLRELRLRNLETAAAATSWRKDDSDLRIGSAVRAPQGPGNWLRAGVLVCR